MVKWIERGADAGPDRRGAGGRELLPADDRGQAGIAGLAAAQRRHARQLKYRLEPRVLLNQRVDGLFEVGLGVEVDEHCRINLLGPSCAGLTRASISYRNRLLKHGLPDQVRQ